jgi:hypothetical protein
MTMMTTCCAVDVGRFYPSLKYLHAMIAVLNHDQMTGAVERNTVGIAELTIACALSADGPQVLPIAVTKNLDAIVAMITHDQIALVVKCNTKRMLKLSFACTTPAERSQEANPVCSNTTNTNITTTNTTTSSSPIRASLRESL